ncbi:MAG: hypothetical protein IMZ75_04435 [Actinobacteria bacterium]|nr:hypothetical protein [Actinomycetota bacterium]
MSPWIRVAAVFEHYVTALAWAADCRTFPNGRFRHPAKSSKLTALVSL